MLYLAIMHNDAQYTYCLLYNMLSPITHLSLVLEGGTTPMYFCKVFKSNPYIRLFFMIALSIVLMLVHISVAKAAVSISNQSITLDVGKTKTLTISGTKNTVTWSSSNTSVASVTSTGKVTAKAIGTATITAAVSGKQLYCKVTVKSKVIGYYAAWANYSGFTPSKIDASKLTHINYAFANINSSLKITLGYPDVDPVNIKQLNALKKTNTNLKTLISVGGWSWSGRFSDAALTDTSRTTFANSCVAFIVKYGFDGVDIDWEYPVSGGISPNKRAADKHNFTLLMQKIREKLDARGKLDGKHYLLTFAGASGTGYVNNIEPSLLAKYVDYANIMTYDIHGPWESYTNFNAPLYNNTDTPSTQYKWSVDSGINTWVNAGFPKSKMVMGVPFYGYIYKAVKNTNKGLYQSYSGAASISYENIAANYLNKSSYIHYYHTTSKVPWLFNGSTFITYENEQSMAAKAGYVKKKGIGGAMIWELSQDPNRVLLNSLSKNLK